MDWIKSSVLFLIAVDLGQRVVNKASLTVAAGTVRLELQKPFAAGWSAD